MSSFTLTDTELQTTRERLALALEASGLGTFSCPLPFDRLEWNDKCKEHFWLPRDAEVDIDVFYGKIHSDDRERVREALEDAIDQRKRYDVEYRTLSPEGEIRWVRAIGKCFYGEDGAPKRFEGVTIDVTSSKRLEEELRSQRRWFEEITSRLSFLNALSEETRELTSPAQVLNVITKRLGRYLTVNRCAYAPMDEDEDGFTVLDNYTDGCESIVGSYKLSMFGRRIFEDLRAGRTIVVSDVDRELTPEDGADAFNSIQIKAVICCPLVKEGKLVALMAVHQTEPRAWQPEDIAVVEEVAERSWNYIERVHSSMALGESETRFRSLVSATALIVWQADSEGKIQGEAPGWEAFTGQPQEQYAGRGWLDAVHPEDRAVALDAWERSLDSHGKLQTVMRVRRLDGEFRRVLVIGVPVTDRAGLIHEWIGTCTDIEDKLTLDDQREALLEVEREARGEAERTSRMKDEFLATLSHELRTPLSAILGWSQILRSGDSLPPNVAQAAEIIERNARTQAQIIEDLLDMNRIVSGKVRLEVQPVELFSVVEAAVETVRPAAAAKGVRLKSVVDSRAGLVSGDPNRLQQVFWNLLSNAIKFTPRGGHVQIVLERVESHVEVSVTDNGEGLSPEFLPHVFERFIQADSSSTRHHGGLGLGLAIVKQLTELHGGTVRAASGGLHQGATFTVALPLLPIHMKMPSEPENGNGDSNPPPVPSTLPTLEGLRLLVVDDEADGRTLASHLLSSQGADVDVAESAEEAFVRLKGSRPDVLISDIGMPREDGLSLIRRIRKLPENEGGAVPAIALTAYARSEDRMNAILAGFQMHVAKPVEAGELITMVASLAGRT